ncbi:hypothetical protein Hanom_Chr15g01387241 [Helianthus anomalus]
MSMNRRNKVMSSWSTKVEVVIRHWISFVRSGYEETLVSLSSR